MEMLENIDRLHKSRTTILILFYLYFVNCQSHVENVALAGTCNMTKRFKNTGDCTKAIDNVTNLTLGFTSPGPENCIHTSDNSTDKCFPFWQLILNEEYTITNITIYNREGNQRRLTYTNVTVNGILCKSFGTDVSTIKNVNTFNCSSPIRGRTITISRHYLNCTNNNDYVLNLCEVQVWVCSKGWYGSDCNTRCSGHCSKSVTCERYDGSCPQGCISGWHGSRCDNSCPQNCVGACNQSSGVCFVTGQSKSDGSAVGAIAGSVICIVVVLSAVVLLTLVYRWRRNSLRKQSAGRSVRPPFDADPVTDLQVQNLSGHKEEEIHCQDVECLNSTYDKLDRNALYQNTKELSVYSQLSINKQNNQ